MVQCVRLTDVSDPLFAEAWRLYEAAFPFAERRPPALHAAAMVAEHDFVCLALQHNGVFAGIIFYWLFADCVYVEHLAIAEALRGRGLGKAALAILRQCGKPVVLEIEPVTDAATQRRLRFYEGAGYHRLPYEHYQQPYHRGESALRLELLSYPLPAEAKLIASFEQDFAAKPMLYRDGTLN